MPVKESGRTGNGAHHRRGYNSIVTPEATVAKSVPIATKWAMSTLSAPLLLLTKPPARPPAACATPFKKDVPQVEVTALYNAVCPPSINEFDKPGLYGVELSKLIYAVRTARVHDVHSSLYDISGVRNRKGRSDVRKVVVLGTRAAVTFCVTVAALRFLEPPTYTCQRLSTLREPEPEIVVAAFEPADTLGADAEADPDALALLEVEPICVRQYFPESSCVQAAFLSGMIEYSTSYNLRTSVFALEPVSSDEHAV